MRETLSSDGRLDAYKAEASSTVLHNRMSTLIPIITSGIILGLSLQKWSSLFKTLVEYNKTKSPLYKLGVACCALNVTTLFVALPGTLALVDPSFQGSLTDVISSTLVFVQVLLIYVLIYKRFQVFPNTTNTMKASISVLIAIGVVARIANWVVAMMVRVPYVLGTPTSQVSPYAEMFALVVILSNTIEAICFIVSSFVFLNQIGSAIGLKGSFLLREMMIKYDGAGYIVLCLVKAYIALVCVVIFLTKKQEGFTITVSTAIGMSHTYAIYLFVKSSFVTPKQMLSSAVTTSDNVSCFKPNTSKFVA
jgi:hypothetical protein